MSSILSASLCSAVLVAAPFLAPALFPLAWIAFVPFFWAIDRVKKLRRAIFYGWLTGSVTYLIGFYWLVHTISVFGGFPYPVSAAVFLIYAALQALQMALFALLVKRFGHGPVCFFAPLYWIVIEFWFPLLFPWYLANSQVVFTSFIQTADLVGPFGASLIVMWFNAALYHVLLSWKQSRQIRWRPILTVALLVIGSVIYGLVRLAAVAKEVRAAAKLDVAAVQGNIDIDLKWNPLQAQHNLEAHRALTKEASGAALVVWPESAVEFWLPDNLQQLPAEVMPSLNSENSHFIFGAKSFTGQLGGPNFKAFNTAFFADAKGRVLDRYHKQVLLAFGEYLPFARLLAKLPGIPFADGFTAGDGPRTFIFAAGYQIAPLICYEDLMPELSRRFVKDAKANLLVNLTNDAWYGRTVAPWQHARLSQWRAIETRRTLLRVTNTGITSVINARGEMAEALPIFAPGVLKAQVAILEGETLYVRFGDWFASTATFVTLGIVLLGLRR